MIDRQKQSEERDKIHARAIEIGSKNTHVLLTYATGVGKSLAALKMTLDYLHDIRRQKVLILVKETNHEGNWMNEFSKWNLGKLLGITEMYCYSSLHKLQNTYWDVIILDEVHCLSELRETYLETLRFGKLISLSATVNSEVKSRLKSIHHFYEDHISTSEAIERGILPEPEIRIVNIEMDEDVSKEYKKMSDEVDRWKSRYYADGHKWQENKWMQAAIKRKRMVSKSKTDIARDIIDKQKNKRLLCFCGSVAQARELGGKQAVHSKNKPEQNKQIITDFNNFVTNKLFTCQMLTESMNLERIESGVIIQLDGVERTGVQRCGRILRGDDPIIYILVCKGTKDEEYLKTLDIDPKYMKNN